MTIQQEAVEAAKVILDETDEALQSIFKQHGITGKLMTDRLATRIVETAAPHIAARALRDAAEELAKLQYVSPFGQARAEYERMLAIRRGDTDAWLRARADRIGGGE